MPNYESRLAKLESVVADDDRVILLGFLSHDNEGRYLAATVHGKTVARIGDEDVDTLKCRAQLSLVPNAVVVWLDFFGAKTDEGFSLKH